MSRIGLKVIALPDKVSVDVGAAQLTVKGPAGTLVTPLSDSILPGITRDSILRLAEDRGHRIERRPITIDEWRAGYENGDIVEV